MNLTCHEMLGTDVVTYHYFLVTLYKIALSNSYLGGVLGFGC
jgi:hypothetical protein